LTKSQASPIDTRGGSTACIDMCDKRTLLHILGTKNVPEFALLALKHRGIHCNSVYGLPVSGSMSFQSPLHRGIHCNQKPPSGRRFHCGFQSPLLRGSHCNHSGVFVHASPSIPFSPLYFGVVTATGGRVWRPTKCGRFQSPLLRGSHCNSVGARRSRTPSSSFSPLYFGVVTATANITQMSQGQFDLSVPSTSG
jgi:hypothetical protein